MRKKVNAALLENDDIPAIATSNNIIDTSQFCWELI